MDFLLYIKYLIVQIRCHIEWNRSECVMRGALSWSGLQKDEPVDVKHDFYKELSENTSEMMRGPKGCHVPAVVCHSHFNCHWGSLE